MANNIAEVKKDLNELQSLHKQATRKRVQDVISLQVRKMETDLLKLEESEKAKDALEKSEKKPTENNTQRVYTVTIRNYSFDESDKFMKLYISLKNVQSLDKDKVTCTFGERNCSFMVKGLDGKNHELTILELAENINSDASYHKVKTDMVVVMLSKAEAGKTWGSVTAAEKKTKMAKKKEMDSNKDDPNAGLMNMMKNMYQDGDDTTKQMLNKTWYETQNGKGGGMGGMPGMGGMGGGMGGMPGMGGMGGGMGGMPGMGGMGGMPGMGGMGGGMPGMGGMGGMPGMGGMGGMPGMGGMGGLGDMAGLDMSKLGDMAGLDMSKLGGDMGGL